MAMDISLDTLSDEGLVRIWEAVMEQVAKDYIDLYILYLKEGEEATAGKKYGQKKIPVKTCLLELEDYIVGDLIAGPHSQYIIHGLRREAREHINSGSRKRKEIMRRQ